MSIPVLLKNDRKYKENDRFIDKFPYNHKEKIVPTLLTFG